MGKGIWVDAPNERYLPSGYTPLSYIKSSGTQYIDLPYTPQQGDEITLENVVCQKNSYQAIFWAGEGDNSTLWTLIVSGDNGCSAYYRYFSNNASIYVPMSYNLNTATTIKSNVSGLYYNDVEVASQSANSTLNTKLRLFRDYDGIYPATAQIGVVTVRNDGGLCVVAVPCRRDSDGAIGMYDIISNTFCGNKGTGSFTAGSVVTQSGNVTREVKQHFVEESLVARKAKNGWVEVNNVARQFFISTSLYGEFIEQTSIKYGCSLGYELTGSVAYHWFNHVYNTASDNRSGVRFILPVNVGDVITVSYSYSRPTTGYGFVIYCGDDTKFSRYNELAPTSSTSGSTTKTMTIGSGATEFWFSSYALSGASAGAYRVTLTSLTKNGEQIFPY